MSLLPPKQQKQRIKKGEKPTHPANITNDKPTYFKEYRQANLEHIKAQERTKYFKKKYQLTDEYVSLFGEHSGHMYKIQMEY